MLCMCLLALLFTVLYFISIYFFHLYMLHYLFFTFIFFIYHFFSQRSAVDAKMELERVENLGGDSMMARILGFGPVYTVNF